MWHCGTTYLEAMIGKELTVDSITFNVHGTYLF